jgi:hypothetical protein
MKPMGERYCGLYMRAEVGTRSEAENRIVEEIVESLQRAERVDTTVRIGRHAIELKGVVPLTFNYMPREQLYVLDPVSISISMPRRYIVFPESEVVVRHPEHGIKAVKFADVYLLGVGTTEVADIHVARLNRLAARRLQ